MIPKKDNNLLALAYIYKNNSTEFWNNIIKAKDEFQNIIIFNFSNELLTFDDSAISIVNFENTSYPEALSNYFTSKKFKYEYVLILEDNERVVFNTNLKETLKKIKTQAHLNIKIEPENYELFEYEIEPFTTYETRLIYLKDKHLKNFLEKQYLFFNKELKTFESSSIVIKKKDVISDALELKVSFLEKTTDERKYFLIGNYYFYKDTKLAEENYLKALKANSLPEEYKSNALVMLLKLFIRRLDLRSLFKLANEQVELGKNNPFYWYYQALAYFENQNYLMSIKYLNKSLKLKANLPLIYNHSDLNWKLFKYLGNICLDLKKLLNTEKFLNIANELLVDKKAPEILLMFARIRFLQENYKESFEIIVELFKLANVPLKTLKEAKTTALNLMLFLDFSEAFLDILSKEVFNKAEDILRIADTFYMAESYVESLQLYLLAVKKFGVDNKLLFKLGYISSKLRILDQASFYFEKYLEYEPHNLEAVSNLAFIYLNMDNFEKAEKNYLKLLELNNFSFEGNLHLAILYMSRKKKEKAEKHLERARTLNPIAPEAIKLYQIFKTEFK